MSSVSKSVLPTIVLFGSCTLAAVSGPLYRAPEGYYATPYYQSGQVINAFTLADAGALWINEGNRFFGLAPDGIESDFYTDPGLVFPSFLGYSADGRLLIGESFAGQLWSLDPAADASQEPVVLASLPGLFDGVAWDDQTWLVSANTAPFPGADNQIFAVDLETGEASPLVQTGGYSGPLVRTGDGGIIYGTADMGASALWAWSQESLLEWMESGVAGGLEDGLKLADGLPAMSGLALGDDPTRDLFSTSWEGPVLRFDLETGGASAFGSVLSGSAGTVQFFRGTQAFEPGTQDGGALFLNVTDWATGTSTIFKVTPIPEPANLFGAGALMLLLLRLFRRRG